MMECLKNIVGVSGSDCECITNGLTDDQKAAIKVSTSGLYMDDLPGGVHLKSLDYLDACQGLAVMSLAERDNAIKTLEDDLTVALNNEYKKAKPNFVGQIGRMSFAQTLATSGLYQGLRLRPIDYGDAVVTVTKLFLIVNASATFPVYLYRAIYGDTSGELLTSWTVTTVANSYASITPTEPLKLPLMIDGKAMEYYFIFNRTEAGGAVPKDNGMACSTCGSSENKLSNFIKAQGVQFDSLTALNDATADSYAHGFTLDASIKCDTEQLFCREYKQEDAISITMARAVWFKAGELLIEAVLKSPNVNRYTTMAREYLWGKRNHFKKEYEGRVEYLAAAINVQDSNCYVCKESSNQPFAAAIFS